MHFATSAIYVILLSFLGGSKTAYADPKEDAFGVTNYGIQCQDRIYPKYAIYAAAKSYCDSIKKIPNFSDRLSKPLFQTRFYHHFSSKTNMNKMLRSSNFILPILEDGSLYLLESGSRKKSAGETERINPGPDRLAIDENCNIEGAITDLSYTSEEIEYTIEECRILQSSLDRFSPFIRSPERSPHQSPPRSRGQSPERSPHQSPPRSRGQSPERPPYLSPPRSRDQSQERLLVSSE